MLAQSPVDADISSLRYPLVGASPLPGAVRDSFGAHTGIPLVEGYGLSVTEQLPIESIPNPHNEAYLRQKRELLGHTLHHQGLALDEELIHDEHQKDIEREALGASETAPPGSNTSLSSWKA